MKRLAPWVLALLVAAAAEAHSQCSVEIVHDEVIASLFGGVLGSNLHISWSAMSEGRDLAGYEVWMRDGDMAKRLAVVDPIGQCGVRRDYEVKVDFDPDVEYWVEVHRVGGDVYFGAQVPRP